MYIQKFIKNKTVIWVFSGVVILILLFLISLLVGSSSFQSHEVYQYLIGQNSSSMIANIVNYVRLPRSIASILCGSTLALSGLLLQAALNNSLASTGTIGINSGSGLFVVIASILFPGVFITKPIFAFVGAVFSASIVYAIARKKEVSRSTLIMAGIAVSSFLAAMSDALITLFPNSIVDKTIFFIGGFSQISMTSIIYLLPFAILLFLCIQCISPRMNVLTLGDEVALSLGLDVKKYRLLLILISSLLAAISISIGGILGFVGLVVPHMMRSIIGYDYRKLIIASILAGSILVLGCDILARILFAPYEIPVGIVLSFIGAPFFLHIILRKPKRLTK